MKTILSLGMGVQSSTIALMSVCGELPKMDAAIFADPGWESEATYDYARWLILYCEERGQQITVTRKQNSKGIRADALTDKRFATMPFYAKTPAHTRTDLIYVDTRTGNQWLEDEVWAEYPNEIPDHIVVEEVTTEVGPGSGMVMRQCTSEYKIQPVLRAIRLMLGVEPRKRVNEKVTLWLGISMDEVERMKESRVPWIEHQWPLIDKRMSRGDCLRWLKAKGFPAPPKSSCIGCPFKGDSSWLALKRDNPKEFADAADFDAKIRTARKNMKSELFLHRSLAPLSEVNFGENEPDMFANECEGHCGL